MERVQLAPAGCVPQRPKCRPAVVCPGVFGYIGGMNTKSRRRWFRFQFSLGTLFVVVALFAVWLNSNINQARNQREAVKLVQSLKGYVHYAHEYDQAGKRDRSQAPRVPPRLINALGEDFFVTVDEVCLTPDPFGNGVVYETSDSDLSKLKGLAGTKILVAIRTKVTDEGLRHLGQMRRLEDVNISAHQITDAGVAHLLGLKWLRRLWLADTQITDVGLEQLTSLPNLRELNVRNTMVTSKGITAFQAAVPLCKVIH